MRFEIINGPCLHLAEYLHPRSGQRMDYNAMVQYVYNACLRMDIETEYYQSNHEGDLIEEILSCRGRVDGILINAAGYAHTSVALLDALRLAGVPAVEVLLDAPSEHEPFRKLDFVALGCQGHFIGEGVDGYIKAAAYLAGFIRFDAQPGPHLAN